MRRAIRPPSPTRTSSVSGPRTWTPAARPGPSPRLIEANGWKSVTVVTSSYHVTRAGRLIGQCTTADVQMVASHPDLDVFQWIRRFVIETGGLIDATFRPECANHGAEM